MSHNRLPPPLDNDESVDTMLLCIAELDYYDVRVFRHFDQHPLHVRAIVAGALRAHLPPDKLCAAQEHFAEIERLTARFKEVAK
jgi:hypothetical protein